MTQTTSRPPQRERSGVRLPRTGSAPTFVALGIAAFAVLLIGMSPTFNPLDVFRGFSVKVPDLSELPQTRALLELENSHLRANVTFAHSSEVGRGLVMRQDPKPGDSARRDDEVDVVVSRGPAQVELPDFVGKPEKDARTTLEELGVQVESVEQNDESVAPGIVLSQSPPAGRTVLGGTKVTLVVSTGPAIRQVPDLKGIALEGAAFRIGQAGLDVGELKLADDPNVPAGAVISSSPNSGEQVPRDTKVALVVSSGLPALGVPNVVGKSQASATNQLGDAGFIVGQITQTGSVDDPDDGKVVAQDPAPNTLLKPGQVVTITVRQAATPSTTVPSTGGG